MNLRDALDVKVGSTSVNKIYKGTYKVWDRNKKALDGYCKQNTTEGINLIEPKIATGTTKNGITITNNGDGSYIINGTATTGTDIRLDQSIPAGTDNLKNYTAGTYSLSCNELKTGLRLVLMQNQTWAKLIEMQYTNTPITKYIEATNNVFFYLYIDGGTTYNNYMLRPQLEKSSTVHDWEPYTGGQPSPNPDYPQEIEVMQGRQVVPIRSDNFIDISTLTDGYVNSLGNIESRAENLLYGEMHSEFIKVEPNTAYTFKIFETNSNYNNWIGVGLYMSNDYQKFISRATMSTTTNNWITFTTTADTEYIVVSARNLKQATKIMLYEGTAEKFWVPYKNEQYTVDLKSKNLFDLSKYNDIPTARNTITLIQNGVRVICATAGTYRYQSIPIPNSDNLLGKTITASANINYSSSQTAGFALYFANSTGDLVSLIKEVGSITSATVNLTATIPNTYPTNANSIVLIIYSGISQVAVGDYCEYTNLQVEEGAEATDYEPYYDYKLAGIGDYKDNFYTDKGKWYFKQSVGNVVLDSTKYWWFNTSSGITGVGFAGTAIANKIIESYGYGLTNYFHNDKEGKILIQ